MMGWAWLSVSAGCVLVGVSLWAVGALVRWSGDLEEVGVRRGRLGVTLPFVAAWPAGLAMAGAHAAGLGGGTTADVGLAIERASARASWSPIDFGVTAAWGGLMLGLSTAAWVARRGVRRDGVTLAGLAVVGALGVAVERAAVDVLSGLLMLFAATVWMWWCVPRGRDAEGEGVAGGAGLAATAVGAAMLGGVALGAGVAWSGPSLAELGAVAVGVLVLSGWWVGLCAARMSSRHEGVGLAALSGVVVAAGGSLVVGVGGAAVVQVVMDAVASRGDEGWAAGAGRSLVTRPWVRGLGEAGPAMGLLAAAFVGLLVASRRSADGDRPALGVVAAPVCVLVLAALSLLWPG